MRSPAALQFPGPKPYHNQSVEVPNTRKPGQTGHYRNAIWGLVRIEDRPLKTCVDAFDLGLSLSHDRPFLGRRPVLSTNPLTLANHFVWQTYSEVDERRRNIGSALHHLFESGVLGKEGEHDTVGLWMQNRPEWQIVDIATHAYKKVSVSLYDTLGKDAVEYIVGHACLTVIFATADHIATLLSMSSRTPMVKMLVIVGDASPETRKILRVWGATINIDVKDFAELEALGKLHRIDIIRPRMDQIASICYTSGTTKNPKGVLLTHRHMMSANDAYLHGIDFGGDEDSTILSYLPLAHIYQRVNELNVICLGGSIGFFSGDPLRLLEDAQILKPNYFPSVPRVLNRMYQMAMLAAQVPGLKGALFRTALDVKLKRMRSTGDNTHAFWDRLVFKRVQAILGGKVKVMTCGSAPISVDAMDFLKVAFSCEVIEGKLFSIFGHKYGMTENSGASSRIWPGDPTSSGTVGPPHPCNELKLVDVPQMGYFATDKPFPRGEICKRGDNCFNVYYKDEEATKETIDEEGWIHTGDVGIFDECGRLRIIDRMKNIIKLSQGEFVALEKVQNIYSTCPLIMQLYVHGDSLRDHLVGIVVPESEPFANLINGVTHSRVLATDVAALEKACKDSDVRTAVLKEIQKEARKGGLKGFESVKNIYLTMNQFTVDNGLLTPTLKVKRREIIVKYKAELENLYEKPLSTFAQSKL